MILRISMVMGLVSAAVLSGCATTAGSTAGGAPAPVAAQAAVLNALFASNASGLQDGSPTYCVRAGGEEAGGEMTRAVVAALRDNPKVKPASACEIADGGDGVFDRQTRQRAVMFTVETSNCPSATECLIRGGYYEGNLSAQTNVYRARLVEGRWNVSLAETGPVS
ncbi:hypothetical protein [Sphingomonas adhaesiva]|uniref:hypothetical protein n=1 Tax=Sphingomonas adhaesiva TaxID=28212 RepID=UPI002FFB4F53